MDKKIRIGVMGCADIAQRLVIPAIQQLGEKFKLISTWERTYRYKGYGYNMCRETKKKLLEAIQKTNLDSADLSMYNNGGWD